MVLALIAGVGYYDWRYPYGRSHCCETRLYLALRTYAEEHGGRFPSGAATAEANLTLLRRAGLDVDLELLRGKTVPKAVAEHALENGADLSEETCGWHYVPGLTFADNPELALFWDRAGLGHWGERLTSGGHVVTFVDGTTEHIVAADWPRFLAQQTALHSQRDEAAKNAVPWLMARIRLPDGRIVDQFDGPFKLRVSGAATLVKSGNSLRSSDLRWWHTIDVPRDGMATIRLDLTLGGMVSRPAEIKVIQNRPIPNTIEFWMVVNPGGQ
jgi:hypothetical protein